MNDTLFQVAALIIPLIIAIVFHEVAHGWTARALGDNTAANLGRLSLNPIKHVDPFGTIILPGMLKLAGLPVFGWAKPVPVIKGRLRNPRRDMMIVAAAGPSSNLIMALIGAVLLGLFMRVYAGQGEPSLAIGFLAANLVNFILLNVFLALFNLLPIPPFDGGHIVEGLLPPQVARKYAGLHNKALLIMILLLVVVPYLVPSLNIVSWLILPPVQWLSEHYMALAGLIAGR
ncbi:MULTISPECIES: site-2 protease family protein [unclassified Novosphingobium]|uniref:site-2 protease family protein n=1 Tax=unclassified Novosphingobium TaxID=2644732 RepID=UPI0025DF0713|nr:MULTISPECIES: site-2 protease family protein [unclassified Novosphingobium]HQV04813.1 site-2 protease family protein [Novosphingobium sp.]